jgi:hypothetical protein
MMKAKAALNSFHALPARVALVIGAVCTLAAPPALAQARAALVQSVDEPARNPYQETLSNTTCRTTTVCAFDFTTIPAGKRLVLTHISGYVDTAGGTLPNVFVSSSFGGSQYATLALTGVRGPTSGLGTRIFINHNVLAYYGAGESVRGVYHVNGTGDTMSGGALLTLTGYFINVP